MLRKPSVLELRWITQCACRTLITPSCRAIGLMVQVQSSWFPLYDRNPQTFVDNIAYASREAYRKATQRIYHDSFVVLPIPAAPISTMMGKNARAADREGRDFERNSTYADASACGTLLARGRACRRAVCFRATGQVGRNDRRRGGRPRRSDAAGRCPPSRLSCRPLEPTSHVS